VNIDVINEELNHLRIKDQLFKSSVKILVVRICVGMLSLVPD